MVIKARSKIYNNIVCGSDRKIYQLEHFKNKRVYPFKELTYNSKRKAYRIYSQWVSKKRLYKLMIILDETIEVFKEQTDLDSILEKLDISLKKLLNTNTK